MPTFFQRYLLPGFAFQAVVIGGGYATGRELAEFFLPSGPWGGLLGMAVTMLIFGVVCALTFEFARVTRQFDYRGFFRKLLGSGWLAFELCYVTQMLLVLSVAGAACGAIGSLTFGAPVWAGTLAFVAVVAVAVMTGNRGVEALFKYWSILLYGTYGLFIVLCLAVLGETIGASFASRPLMAGWFRAGVEYSGYNLLSAIVILHTIRFATSRRDAITAGLLCGPLAMLPAVLFFIAMAGYYPQIGTEAVPSSFLLAKLGSRAFEILYQVMIFGAIVETGVGMIHALNERLAATLAAANRSFPRVARSLLAVALLFFALVAANRLGLITLIGEGYGTITYFALAVYVLPVLTVGAWRVFVARRQEQRA